MKSIFFQIISNGKISVSDSAKYFQSITSCIEWMKSIDNERNSNKMSKEIETFYHKKNETFATFQIE